MNFRKNSTLIIGGGIGVVLLAAVVFLLFSFRGQYAGSLEAFNNARNRLAALNNRNPFPSAENIKLSSENLDLLKSKYNDVRAKLMAGQMDVAQIEPARFAPMMEDSIKRLKTKVQQLKNETGREIRLPAEVDFGFKDYAAGKLPPNDTNTMRRLVLQVQGLENLTALAIDARVDSVDSLKRDDFEIRTPAAPAEEESGFRGRGRGRFEEAAPEVASTDVGGFPLPAPHALYDVERFLVEVSGPESAIWDYINRLAASPVLFTVADVAFSNTRTSPGRPVDFKELLKRKADEAKLASGGQADPAAEMQPADLSADERVVGGREPVKARLVIDMILLKNDAEGNQP